MNYNQIIIRALTFYINEMQHCDEESRQLFAVEAAEARIALAHIEQ